MAERIVSPGVFTREKDLSFLPQGVGEIGGCIIGPTKTGPAFWPTIVNNFEEFKNIFGDLSTDTYIPYTAKEYLRQAGRVTIVRTLGRSAIADIPMYAIHYSGSDAGADTVLNKTVATLIPSAFEGASSTACTVETTPALTGAGSANGHPSASAFVVALTGATGTVSGFADLDDKDASGTAYSASMTQTSDAYIGNLFGYNPNTTKRAFLWTNFRVHQQLTSGSALFSSGTGLRGGVSGSIGTFSLPAYQEATTPWITTQKDSVNSSTNNLFRFKTLSHGTSENWRFKIGISNVQISTTNDKGYGTFTVNVIRQDQTYLNEIKGDRNPYTNTTDTVVESFTGCTLDPDDSNFVVRRIGDRYYKIDNEGKLIGYNDYPNKSKFIRIEAKNSVLAGTISKDQLPFGFAAITDPIPSTVGTSPSCSFVTRQGTTANFMEAQYYGFNFNFQTSEDSNGNPAGFDNMNYLNVTPNANSQTGGNVAFNLSDMYGHADAQDSYASAADGTTLLTTTGGHTSQRKFIVPFQGGFDGIHPSKHKLTGANMTTTNVMGHDISSTSAEGTVAYKRAIDSVSNPDEWDINLLVTPGLIYTHASSIQNYALRKVEARADCFYLIDVAKFAATPVVSTQITDATTDAGNFDTSYAATYYPWVKMVDTANNKHVWVPPSVVVAGVIAQTDQLSHPWFAPAGLTRGGLTSVLEPATRLTHSERDDLYDGRVNPIAAFPGQNVTVWGQKTLQKKASALDRINVRRLMITVKKFIASSTKFLVFEQNTASTRNRFLGIVNPYLENVQSNSGLYAFKVVMDETNNTPDVIDRNELRGQIFLQPTKTAEFIVLDFNILPTGAEFPE